MDKEVKRIISQYLRSGLTSKIQDGDLILYLSSEDDWVDPDELLRINIAELIRGVL